MLTFFPSTFFYGKVTFAQPAQRPHRTPAPVPRRLLRRLQCWRPVGQRRSRHHSPTRVRPRLGPVPGADGERESRRRPHLRRNHAPAPPAGAALDPRDGQHGPVERPVFHVSARRDEARRRQRLQNRQRHGGRERNAVPRAPLEPPGRPFGFRGDCRRRARGRAGRLSEDARPAAVDGRAGCLRVPPRGRRHLRHHRLRPALGALSGHKRRAPRRAAQPAGDGRRLAAAGSDDGTAGRVERQPGASVWRASARFSG